MARGVAVWARGVAVNMSPCRGEDRRFESGRARTSTSSVRVSNLD